MAGKDVPADFTVARLTPDGVQKIFTCADHVAATIRALNPEGTALALTKADPSVHSCKGCNAEWPTG